MHPSSFATTVLSLTCLAILAEPARAQFSFLAADGPGNTYAHLTAGGYNIEVPDCAHKVDHFVERMDPVLGKPVFAATMHVNDNDRCMNYDRQRIELRGIGAAQQGAKGKTTHYRWKFKLDAGFRETGNFCHIFQIKAYGNGHGSGAPIVTLTPRSGNFEIYHRGTVKSAPVSRFKGVWVEAHIRATHENGAAGGSLAVTLRRVEGGETLHSWSATGIDMWDDGAGYGAPKFGLYRSLASKGSLRDEDVLLADIAVTLGEVEIMGPTTGIAPREDTRWAPAAKIPRLVLSHNRLLAIRPAPGAAGANQPERALFTVLGASVSLFPARPGDAEETRLEAGRPGL